MKHVSIINCYYFGETSQCEEYHTSGLNCTGWSLMEKIAYKLNKLKE